MSGMSVDEQAKAFLTTFVYEFQGRFEEVLNTGPQGTRGAVSRTGTQDPVALHYI